MKKRQFLALTIAGTLVISAFVPLAMAQEQGYAVIADKEAEGIEEFSDWSSDEGFAADSIAEESYEDSGAAEVPAEESYGGEEIPMEETPVEEIPVEETPIEETPAEEIPAPAEESQDPVVPEEDPFTGQTGEEDPAVDPGTQEGEGTITPDPSELITPEPEIVVTEAPVEETTEAPVQTETEAPTETTTEEKLDPSLPVQVIRVNPGASSELLRTYKTLNEAVDQEQLREDFAGRIDILLTGNVSVDSTVNVPYGVSVNIGSASTDIKISRGTSFGGSLFAVDGRLQFSVAKDTDGSSASRKLTVDGGGSSVSAVSGALVDVMEDGTVGIQEGVTLTNNYTSAPGSAINFHSGFGSLLLAGGSITGNTTSTEYGGAIFAADENNSIQIGIPGTSEEVHVVQNVNGSSKPANIVLGSSEGTVGIGGPLTDSSEIHLYRINPVDGEGILELLEESGLTEEEFGKIVKTVFQFDDSNFTIDEDGCLAKKELTPTPTFTLTPTPTGKVTVTPTVTLTVTPTVTPTLTPTVTPTYTPTPTPTSVPYIDPTDTPTPTPTPTNTPTPTPTDTPIPVRQPYVPDISECSASGDVFNGPHQFPAGVRYDFEAFGASAMDHYTELVEGDGRWEFMAWSIGETGEKQANLKIGVNQALTKSATYPMWIWFRLYTWDAVNAQWVNSGVVDHIEKSFEVQGITVTPTSSPTPKVTGSGGGGSSYNSGGSSSSGSSSTSSTDYVSLTRAAQATGTAARANSGANGSSGSGTGTSSTTTSVRTADEAPLGSMSLLAMFALLSGVFAFIRRNRFRKN